MHTSCTPHAYHILQVYSVDTLKGLQETPYSSGHTLHAAKKRRVSILDTMKVQFNVEAEANTTASDRRQGVKAEIKNFESIKGAGQG